MAALVNLLHAALTPLFDLVCRPFLALPPIWALAVISCCSGVLLVWLFGRTSDQERIHEVRDRIRGNLLGVRLFQRDITVVLRLQRRIFGDTFRFLRLAVVPMLIMLAPVVLIMTQLNLRFAVRSIAPGESAVVTAAVRDPAAFDGTIALEPPDGVTVETPPVRIHAAREIAWRVRVERAGAHTLRVRVGDDTVDKTIAGGAGWGPVAQRRTGRGVLDLLLYPGEPPIPAGHPVEAVEIAYPPLEIDALGLRVDWLIGFLVLSMAFGFACKGLLGVEI